MRSVDLERRAIRAAGGGCERRRAAIEGWIENEAARALFSAGGNRLCARTAAAAHPGFKAVPLGLRSTRRFTTRFVVQFANVIARVAGAHNDEYVIIRAHWDSLGIDAARAGHNVFNGAVDNATGVAGLLALAQSFMRTTIRKPTVPSCFSPRRRRSPIYWGRVTTRRIPFFRCARPLAVINVDMLHRRRSYPGYQHLRLRQFSDLEESARAEALLQGRETHPEPDPELGLYFRSDSYSFAHRGVPALYAQAGIDNAARGPVWGQAQIDLFCAPFSPAERSIFPRLGCAAARSMI